VRCRIKGDVKSPANTFTFSRCINHTALTGAPVMPSRIVHFKLTICNLDCDNIHASRNLMYVFITTSHLYDFFPKYQHSVYNFVFYQRANILEHARNKETGIRGKGSCIPEHYREYYRANQRFSRVCSSKNNFI